LKLGEKKKIVEDLHDRLNRAKIIILTDFKGMNVATITTLRSDLSKDGLEYQVAKNTLLSRAVENTDLSLIRNELRGPSAIAVSYDDPVILAKKLIDFAAKNDKFKIKSGIMGGKMLDLNDIKALSKLPSREVLLAMVLSAMNGVPTALVRVLNEVPRSMLNVLQAIKDQKEAA
jgi:large subunit ribosomal protein L10